MNKKPTNGELKKISETLPNVKYLLKNGKENYNKIFVSVFENWLKPEELDRLYDQDFDVLAKRRFRFEQIICEFYNMTSTYIWRYKRHYRIIFYKPTSLQHLLLKCDIKNQNYWFDHRYDILLPEFSAVYSEGSDWTNIIWYRNLQQIEPLSVTCV